MRKIRRVVKTTKLVLPSLLLTACWSVPAMATKGDVYAPGTEYCATTYKSHPVYSAVGGTPVDLNVGDGWYDNKFPLHAPEDGSVFIVSHDNGLGTGWGNSITWTNGDETLYLAHLYDFGKTGTVKSGEIIGYVGTTGKSTAPHLHIQSSKGKLVLSGDSINPANYPACKKYTSKGPVVGGPGGPTPPTDPPAPGKLPDFITDEVQMADRNGNERYRWKSNETAYVHAYIDNVGNADWEGKKDHIKVSFYLSKGTKVDRHSEWVRIGREEIKKENLKVKKKAKHEYIAFSLNQWASSGHIVPGSTYNIVVCADRYKDEDNGYGYVKEKHESNNCSTEAVFYVDSIEPPKMPDLTAHSLQLNSGSATLTGGSLYGLTVNMRNAGNGSAESSFQIKYEIKGPSTGGLWKTVGEKSFTAVPFAAGANQQIKTGDDFAAAPVLTGDYLLRACADSKQAVTESNEGNNCSGELAVYVSPASAFSAKPVYRFWSSEQASHFYTISEAEKDRVIAIYTPYQWQYERVEGCALPSQEDDSFPVYRFYSSPLTLHRYTISEEEKTSLLAMPQTFKYEGIAWYAYTYQKEGTVPVYRFYSETYKSHFYTISEAERDLVIEKYPDEMWRYDGIAWYVFECP